MGESSPTNNKEQPLSTITIDKVISYNISITAGRAYKSTEARYLNTAIGSTKTIMHQTESPTYLLKKTYPNKQQAHTSAQSALVAIKKGNRKLELEIQDRCDLHIKQPIKVTGLRQGIDGDYIITEIKHTFATDQLKTKIKATTKLE